MGLPKRRAPILPHENAESCFRLLPRRRDSSRRDRMYEPYAHSPHSGRCPDLHASRDRSRRATLSRTVGIRPRKNGRALATARMDSRG